MGKVIKLESLIKKESCDVIHAKHLMVGDGNWVEDDTNISDYDNIVLLEKENYKDRLSLYIAWDDGSNEKFLFLV